MPVAARVRRPRAPPFIDPPGHARHRPEATLLYQLVGQHYPERPLTQRVLSLPHALRFLLATKPAVHMQVRGVVYRTISRCPKCHVALWSNYGGGADLVRFVRIGTRGLALAHVPRFDGAWKAF